MVRRRSQAKTYAHYAEVQASEKMSSFHLAWSLSASSAEVFLTFVLQVVRDDRRGDFCFCVTFNYRLCRSLLCALSLSIRTHETTGKESY